MRKSGKHFYGTGRGRQLRHLDRAQLEFEEMLIEDFLDQQACDPEAVPDHIPVRYGSDLLATHLSDSGIAAAIIDAESFQASLNNESMAVSDFYQGDLFALVAERRHRRVEDSATASAADDATPMVASCRPRFSVWGILQGFMLGAVACGTALMVLRLLT